MIPTKEKVKFKQNQTHGLNTLAGSSLIRRKASYPKKHSSGFKISSSANFTPAKTWLFKQDRRCYILKLLQIKNAKFLLT